mmetsp:Transcript_27080/g.42355  ORF Transcript_27080/g.42355 Transcript_27080/m.42355 type:complete len:329 (+) Transcript_27080:253-1239(+)|eukprot:CAMPEP_0184297578 /NCGR_PEP_ID=MMETSP1049-20130417/8476_1 /TAXON_ID=77928 /ORGANISM="Proteomonas sulcata, Strain CCMP704" /LENGTH=328 /DNA_ID=CAMNT_0026607367 /DNA_START=237 /DNA_END=1223 /DNA_ORIENTATION=-
MIPLMTPDSVVLGAIVGGVINALVIIVTDSIMDGIPEFEVTGLMAVLTRGENWMTFTENEDAVIINTFFFKIVTKYFMLFLVAFGANNTKILGDWARCPDWQCMPILEWFYVTTMLTEVVYNLIAQNLFPAIKRWVESIGDTSALQAKAGVKIHRPPWEEQETWAEPAPVVELYKDKVYQFGYIAMFGVVNPIMTIVCLFFNVFDMRARALTLLTKNRRPDPAVAADIGSYQIVMDRLSLLAIITNSCLMGFTSHGLYFYFPNMDMVQALWCTVIFEHILFIIRILIGNFFPEEPADAVLTWQTQQEKKHNILNKWGLTENIPPDPTP